jgi:DNA-binding NarL/FixJ family response regulator
MRVLIADDHPIVRKGLRRLLESSGIDVVAEAVDAREALRLAVEERPDVAVLDLFMPAGGGLEATRRILRERPGTRVVVVSGVGGSKEAGDAIHAGAMAFLPKTATYPEILAAVRAAHEGQGRVARAQAGAPASPPAPPLPPPPASDRDQALALLTRREREVLQMVAQGHSSSSAAAALGVSSRTIEAHRQRVMDKLNIHSVSGLTRFAIEHGLA